MAKRARDEQTEQIPVAVDLMLSQCAGGDLPVLDIREPLFLVPLALKSIHCDRTIL
jgi:hypothetical protein